MKQNKAKNKKLILQLLIKQTPFPDFNTQAGGSSPMF